MGLFIGREEATTGFTRYFFSSALEKFSTAGFTSFQQLALQGTFLLISFGKVFKTPFYKVFKTPGFTRYFFSSALEKFSKHHCRPVSDSVTWQDDYWYFNANLGARTGQLRAR